MKSRKLEDSAAGMTLIEVLVAFVIAAVGVFGVLSVFPQSYRLSRDSGRITELNHLAAEKIDELQSLDFQDTLLTPGTHPAQATDSAGARYYPIYGWAEAYSLRWEVLDGPSDSAGNPEPNMKTVVVEAAHLRRYDTTGAPIDRERGLAVVFRTFLTD